MEESKQLSFVGTGMDESSVLLLIRKSTIDGGYLCLTPASCPSSSNFRFKFRSLTAFSSFLLTTSSLSSILRLRLRLHLRLRLPLGLLFLRYNNSNSDR